MNRNRNIIHKNYAEIHEQPHKSRFNATKKKGHGSKFSKAEIAEYIALKKEMEDAGNE